jgi:hypothetical protein
MPIYYTIDHERRLVVAAADGVVSDEDVFGHQREVWSRTELAWYDEIIDMTHATEIAVPHGGRVRDLAKLSASMDVSGPKSRFAIVAPGDLAFGLGRMFQAFREIEPESRKQVGVFRTLEEAMQFLGLKKPPVFPRRTP